MLKVHFCKLFGVVLNARVVGFGIIAPEVPLCYHGFCIVHLIAAPHQYALRVSGLYLSGIKVLPYSSPNGFAGFLGRVSCSITFHHGLELFIKPRVIARSYSLIYALV